MTVNEIEHKIQKMIRVTPQQVTLAKAFLYRNYDTGPVGNIEKLLKAMLVHPLDEIFVLDSVNPEAMIKQIADAISWTLAGCEAIWGLISSNLLIPDTRVFQSPDLNISYTETEQGSGRYTRKLSLNHLTIPLPSIVRLPYSSRTRNDQPLSDADLFIHDLDIPNLHRDVEEALREAVRCFHQELYLACLAMLGRSSEGAWIELGLKLAKAVERTSAKQAAKVRTTQQDIFVGLGKKILQACDLYGRIELEDLRKESGVTLQDLKNSVIWADAVRDSRNSIHYGAEPALPNSYEKVAALLIGAVPHLRILYRIYNTVDIIAPDKAERD